MRRAQLALGLLYLLVLFSIMGVGLLVFGIGFSPETIADYRATMIRLYDRASRPAAVGLWGLAGAIGWRLTGHQAAHIFFYRFPRAWQTWAEKPWRKKTLGGTLPLLKSLALGAVFLTGGAAAAEWFTSVSGQALSTGVWSGAALGAMWSLYPLWTKGEETVPKPSV